MSKIVAFQATCPRCEHTWEDQCFSSFNAERLPHLLDAVLYGTFEEASCASCGLSFQLEHEMLFSWLPRRLWIVMFPPEALFDFAHLEREVLRTFEEVVSGTPEEFKPLVDSIQPQIVFGQRQLAEAVRANQHNLPPAHLECAKLALLRDHIEELMPLGPLNLTYEGLEAPGQTLRFKAWSLQGGGLLGELRAERSFMAQLEAQEGELRASYPALFERPFVNVLRYIVPEPS